MIIVDYSVSPSSLATLKGSDVLRLTEDDLHYNYLLGSIEFIVEEKDFSARWNWIPIIDFAIDVIEILNNLPIQKKDIFYFTESDAKIEFAMLSEDRVAISSNYGKDNQNKAEANYIELKTVFLQLLTRIIVDVRIMAPNIIDNPYIELIVNRYQLRIS